MNGSREGGSGGAPRARLSTPVKWAFAGTVLASAASLLWPNRELVQAQDRGDLRPASVSSQVDSSRVSDGPRAPTVAPLPTASSPRGDRAAASTFDPFVGVVPPPPPAPPPVAPVPVAAPPPPPPTQEYRFLGRVSGPDGIEQLLLSRGDVPVAVQVGTTLENGYVVQSISTDAVVLVYPPLGVRSTIPIGANPAAP